IATTNRRLEQSVEKKEFREDLFFRLNVVPIHVPPLRDHREDIQPLAEEFMRRFSRKHGIHVRGLSDSALRVLKEHHWPGNVRELQNVLERAVILCGDSGVLEAEHFGMSISSAPPVPATAPSPHPAAVAPESGSAASEGDVARLAEMEKRHILAVLERCHGNRTHAARMLDISIRTLRNKLHEYSGTSPKSDTEEEAVSEN